jgi:hypothetical protein
LFKSPTSVLNFGSANGIKTAYLDGDAFYLPLNQMHTENYGAKGVKYLASRKGADLQEEPSND